MYLAVLLAFAQKDGAAIAPARAEEAKCIFMELGWT